MEDKDSDSLKNCLDNCENDGKNNSKESDGADLTDEEHVSNDVNTMIDTQKLNDEVNKESNLQEINDSKAEHESTNTETVKDSQDVDHKTDECIVQSEFKKPTFIIGPKRGKHGKIRSISSSASVTSTKVQQEDEENNEESSTTEKVISDTEHTKSADEIHTAGSLKLVKNIPLPYQEPSWSTKPEKEYKLEVLKSGVILQTIDLSDKGFHVVGRLPNCDISLAHPTISRFHAIFQYRGVEDAKNQKGLYIYDLGSTHGTFWNGNRIRPNVYIRLYDGHMIRFGCSQRKYILQAPDEDREEESELSVTELKEKRILELQERERLEAEYRLEMEEEEKLRKEEEENGIDWGMGEDAEEETDLTENPYAATNNEELFLNDPKKTLRGWFEREGYDLQYHTEEKGFAQFLCWVDLPIENVVGHTVRAEALVKGKKKECVIQCALEACKILDRHGLLRQATHEGRKRKARNWEEDDYYSSDEDNFLDRTGSIEKKREHRMKLAGKLEPQVDTYESLMEKHSIIVKKITDLVDIMRKSQIFESEPSKNVEDEDEDALDAFMSSLNAPVLNKVEKRKMKRELQDLRQEEARLIKLLNSLRPANLPRLTYHVVPLNEQQKPSEMFDNKLNIDQEKDLQMSSDETTNMDIDIPAKSKQDVNDSSNKKIGRMNKDNFKASSLTEDQAEISDNTDQYKHDIQINFTKEENNLHIVENVNTTKTCLPDNTSSSSRDQQSKNNAECKEKVKGTAEKSNTKKQKVTKTVKKTYDEDIYNANYSTWVPPQDQTGDGKTNLNAKYGY
ncbi:hypothetical protein KPH14_005325 [Odynerus spinipes]|uniref:FHA domain-containing protein n=1 Tax=Odynerus spinipes TaxID=1348599 RepID=A0AAD9VJ93_9HYME|nr:hypothetical protein KPH14_005325 [Odynerus spinipes]